MHVAMLSISIMVWLAWGGGGGGEEADGMSMLCEFRCGCPLYWGIHLARIELATFSV